MTMRTILLLLVAVAAAGLTAFYARSWITAERAAILASVPQEAEKADTERVLIAKKDLQAGTFITKKHLTWQAWPEEGVNDGYVVEGERPVEDFIGAVVRTTVTAGEPITDARVVQPGDRGFLAAVLTPGMRAVSVPVNATSGISGLVFPGDSVDVILTAKFTDTNPTTGDPQTRYFSETLLTEIRILAIDQRVENIEGEAMIAKTSTLEVNQKQAEKIAIALEMGSLSLSLHSLAREEIEQIQETADSAAPLGVAGRAGKPDIKTKPVAKPNPRSFTMDSEVYYMGSGHLGGAQKTVTILRGTTGDNAEAKASANGGGGGDGGLDPAALASALSSALGGSK